MIRKQNSVSATEHTEVPVDNAGSAETEKATTLTGKALVRAVFITRLEEAGFKRRRGTSVDLHEAEKKRACELLAYMSRENLEVLAETLIDEAQGDVWPSELVIRSWASGLQERPIEEKPIIRSWLASIEGPKAIAEGRLVETFRWLKRSDRRGPPLAMDKRSIRDDVHENQRRLQIIRERGEPLSQEDEKWITAYRADEREAMRIVEEGRAKREGAEQ